MLTLSLRCLCVAGLLLSLAAQPATQPSTPPPSPPSSPPPAPPSSPPPTQAAPGSIEFRTQQALANREYATALDLLKRMAEIHREDARKLKAIEEQIRYVERQIAIGDGAPNPLAAEHRKPIPAPVEGQTTNFANIKDLGNFEYNPEVGGGIPADVLAVSNTSVRVRGFMIPLDQAENITSFALVPDLFACCFGQPPQIQHMVVVRTPKGRAVSYYPDEIVVEGKLLVEEKKEEGFIISLFEVSATSVRPAPK
jgi:hypothetical protein